MKHIFIILSLCFLYGCSAGSDNISNTPTPRPSPTVSAEDVKKRDDKRIAQDRAIADFIAKSYKGWTLNGISSSLGACRLDDENPCYLHLVNGSQTKVIPVMIRKFEKPDKSTYWLAFEAQPQDLARAKIERIKGEAREEAYDDAQTDERH